MTFKKVFSLLIIFSLLFTVACKDEATTLGNESGQVKEEELSLKIGLMPAVDSAPILLAKEKGYFEDLGLDLEIEIFYNAQDRQSALQTGAIDGAMTDLIAIVTNVNGGFDIKATTMTSGMFPVLVKEGYTDKKDIKVGMMEVSVSNFLIDEWLSEDYNIEKVFINELPARLEMIKNGNLDMGLFPEPMASMGALGGLDKKIYEVKDGYCPDVMAFTGKALEEKSKAIELFHKGYDKGIEAINNDENLARDILIEKLNLKPEVKDDINLPSYANAKLPNDEYIDSIILWVKDVLKEDVNVKPNDLVTREYVK